MFYFNRITAILFFPLLGYPYQQTGLSIEKPETRLAHITYNGEPLLAFGCHFEHMYFDEYDYKNWTQWAVEHWMNHCRARLYHKQA